MKNTIRKLKEKRRKAKTENWKLSGDSLHGDETSHLNKIDDMIG